MARFGYRFTTSRSVGGGPEPEPEGLLEWTPLDVTSLDPVLWLRSDYGLDLVSDSARWWLDLTSNANDIYEPTAGMRFSYSASGGPDGHPCLSSTGGKFTKTRFAWTAADISVGFFVWLIARQNSLVSGTALMAGQTNRRMSFRNMSSSTCGADNGSNASGVPVTAGTWYRHRALFTGSTDDNWDVGANGASGTSLGTSTSGTTPLTLGGTGSGTNLCNASYAELFIGKRKGSPVSAEDIALFEAYGAARYPSVTFNV